MPGPTTPTTEPQISLQQPSLDVSNGTPVANLPVQNIQEQTQQQLVDNLSRQQSTSNKVDNGLTIKDHPLYAPWRDMESMQFPEKKEKIKKLKNSLSDKDGTEKEGLDNSDKRRENQSEKNIKKNEKQAEKELKNNEKQAEKDKKSAEKKASKEEKKAEHAKKKAERKAKRKEKRAKFNEKVTLNPFSRVRYGGKETLKTAFSLPANIIAKAAHIVGRPQSLFVGEMWSDLAKNTGRGFANFFRTIAGTVYKPYRTKLPYENIFKDYGASFNPEGSKGLGALGLGLLRGFWSIPRIPAQLVEGVAHTVSETATGKFDYTHTTDAFKKAFSIIHDKPASSSDTAKK